MAYHMMPLRGLKENTKRAVACFVKVLQQPLVFQIMSPKRLVVAECDGDAAVPVEAEQVRALGGTHGALCHHAGMTVHVTDVGHAVVAEFHTAGLVGLQPFIVTVDENAAFRNALREDARAGNLSAELRMERGGHVIVIRETLPWRRPVGGSGAEERLLIADVRGDEDLEVAVLFRLDDVALIVFLRVEADIHAVEGTLREEYVIGVVQILFETQQDLFDV